MCATAAVHRSRQPQKAPPKVPTESLAHSQANAGALRAIQPARAGCVNARISPFPDQNRAPTGLIVAARSARARLRQSGQPIPPEGERILAAPRSLSGYGASLTALAELTGLGLLPPSLAIITVKRHFKSIRDNKSNQEKNKHREDGAAD
jgi:hypothetical protein